MKHIKQYDEFINEKVNSHKLSQEIFDIWDDNFSDLNDIDVGKTANEVTFNFDDNVESTEEFIDFREEVEEYLKKLKLKYDWYDGTQLIITIK